MSITKVGRGSVYVAVQNVAQFAVGLIFYSILARLLTKADIGLVSTLTFAVTIYSVFATLTLNVAAAKYISEYIGKGDPEKASSVAKKTTRLIATLSIILLIPAILISQLLGEQNYSITLLFVIACITSSFASLKSTYLSFLQGSQSFGKYALAGTSAIVAARAFSIILVLLNYGLLGIIIGWLLGEVLGFILAFSFFHGTLPKTSSSYDSRQLLNFSMPLFLFTLINTASDWTDRMLFLAITPNLGSLGIYDLAIRGSATLSLITTVLSTILLPFFSELFGQSGTARLSEPLTKASRYLTFLIFPAALGLASISKTAMALLFGWEYAIGNIPLSILALASIFTAFTAVINAVLQSIGETRVFIKISLTMVIANLIASVALIPSFNIIGSATARSTMMILGFTYSFYELDKRVKVKLDRKATYKAFLASTIMAIPLILFDSTFSRTVFMNPVISIFIEIVMGILVYGFVLLLLNAFKKEDFNILREIVPRQFRRVLDAVERIFIR